MENPKPLSFSATASSYFVLAVVSIVLAYIPVFGWAGLLSYAPGWFAERTLVNGKKISYRTSYGENLKFVFLNFLLVLITLGIYSFWFYPKMYRYIADNVFYADAVPAVATTPAETSSSPTPPVNPIS